MDFADRYCRNMNALHAAECAMLAKKHVVVIGCGGLGGMVVESLVRIGVGSLRIIDGDVFEPSNLNRQLSCTEQDIGREKAVVTTERAHAVNSSITVEPVVAMLEEENAPDLLKGADCIVDCLDNLEARFWAAHTAQELGIPIIYGAIAGWFGQVCTVFPGDHSFATIYGAIEGESAHKELGNLPFTAYTTAAIQAAEAVKVLLGRPGQLRNRLLMIDLIDGSFDEIELH